MAARRNRNQRNRKFQLFSLRRLFEQTSKIDGLFQDRTDRRSLVAHRPGRIFVPLLWGRLRRPRRRLLHEKHRQMHKYVSRTSAHRTFHRIREYIARNIYSLFRYLEPISSIRKKLSRPSCRKDNQKNGQVGIEYPCKLVG